VGATYKKYPQIKKESHFFVGNGLDHSAYKKSGAVKTRSLHHEQL